jgi:hypothetical protein
MKTKSSLFNLRTLRLALLAYVLCDMLAGYAGMIPGLSSTAAGQSAPSIAFMGQKAQFAHNLNGVWYAPAYATWQATVLSGNSATGSQTIIVTCSSGGVQGVCTLADGYSAPLTSIFNTNTPITLLDANVETVTPSAVGSPSPCPSGFLGVGSSTQCVTVTATFASTHGASAPIVSGDAGIFEAITDAGASGGGVVYWQVDTGIVTLTTSGLTTTTTTKVPTNFYNMGAAARVTTSITVTASWAVGISGATGIFCSANSTLTAGTTCLANQASPASTGTTSALTAILITGATSNPGAGAVKARVWGWTPVQPAS